MISSWGSHRSLFSIQEFFKITICSKYRTKLFKGSSALISSASVYFRWHRAI